MLVLLARAYAEDEEFARIFDKYYGYAFKICYNKIHNYHDVEEVINTAFYKIYLSLKRDEPENSIKSFIATVVTNESINFLVKKSRKSPEVEMVEEYDYSLDEWDNAPLERVINDEGIDFIYNEILKLKPKISQTMMLAYKHKYSVKEIAYILDIPEKTVYSRIRNGKKQLEKQLLNKLEEGRE